MIIMMAWGYGGNVRVTGADGARSCRVAKFDKPAGIMLQVTQIVKDHSHAAAVTVPKPDQLPSKVVTPGPNSRVELSS